MSLHDTAVAAAELVAALGDQAARDRDSWNAGYAYAARTFFELGHRAGWMAAERAAAERWAPVADHVRRIAGQPTHAELERRRWGPGGREHFADPRPGDYPGQQRRGAA